MAGRRDQLRAEDLATPAIAARSLGATLLDIYLRLEALERAASTTAQTLAQAVTSISVAASKTATYVLNFTTGADVAGSFPLTFPFGWKPTGQKVINAVNNTSGAALFYDAVAAQNCSWLAGVFTVGFITGLVESTSYTVTLEISYG